MSERTNDGDTKAAIERIYAPVPYLRKAADRDLIAQTLERLSVENQGLRERNDALITDRNAANERLSEQEAELERCRALRDRYGMALAEIRMHETEADHDDDGVCLDAILDVAQTALTQDSPEERP